MPRWWSCFRADSPKFCADPPPTPDHAFADAKRLAAKQAERILALGSEPVSLASSADAKEGLVRDANWSRRGSSLLVASCAGDANSKDIAGLVELHERSLQGLQHLIPEHALLNDLKLLSELGHGGYARCYEGQWRAGVRVAVKVFCTSPASHQRGDSTGTSAQGIPLQAVAEGLLCKTLAHPNVVHTFDARCSCLSFEFLAAVLCEDKSDAALLRDIPRLATHYKMKLSPAEVAVAVEQVKQLVLQWSDPSWSKTPLIASAQPKVLGGSAADNELEIWQSEEGFGDPQDRRAPCCWRDILLAIGAYPGSYVTVLIMQYCEMGTLENAILKGVFRPRPASGSGKDARRRFRVLLRTLREVAQALEYFDQCGLVHGDIKPANVLLNSSRTDARGFTAQVADLGMMSITESEKGGAKGTVQFMSPEMFLTGNVTSAADIYALGILMWTMVTATRPYADLPEDHIMKHVSVRKMRPKWPPNQFVELEKLYSSCVAHKPESRPTAAQVVKALIAIEEAVRRMSCSHSNPASGPLTDLKVPEEQLSDAQPAEEHAQHASQGNDVNSVQTPDSMVCQSLST